VERALRQARRNLDWHFLALWGLWFRKWACRGKDVEAAGRAWEKFLETHIVERWGDYFVVERGLASYLSPAVSVRVAIGGLALALLAAAPVAVVLATRQSF